MKEESGVLLVITEIYCMIYAKESIFEISERTGLTISNIRNLTAQLGLVWVKRY